MPATVVTHGTADVGGHRGQIAEQFAERLGFEVRFAGQGVVEVGDVRLVVFGVVDLGRGVFAYNTISSAAREGVRYAVVHGASSAHPVGPTANDAGLAAVVAGFAVGIQNTNLVVLSSWPNGNATGAVVNVTVQYTFHPVTAFFSTLALSNHSSAIILH